MERQAATDTDPRTLDLTHGLTTAVLVERSTGARGNRRWCASRGRCYVGPLDQYGRDISEGCRLTARYQAQKQSSHSCNKERHWVQRLSGSDIRTNPRLGRMRTRTPRWKELTDSSERPETQWFRAATARTAAVSGMTW